MRASEPIFNVPPVITALLAVLVLIHGVRDYALSDAADAEVLKLFAFVPLSETLAASRGTWSGGYVTQPWTFVTYAFLHGDWVHLIVNGVWLLAFGTPVARRFGTARFLVFFALTAAAGAAAHLAVHAGTIVPVVGASASISGLMAAALRFVFQRSGPLSMIGRDDPEAYRVPALPLTRVLRNGRVLVFLGVWFGLNLLFGLGSLSIDGGEQAIAWEAHVGGFLAGLLGFALIDPVKAAPAPEPGIH